MPSIAPDIRDRLTVVSPTLADAITAAPAMPLDAGHRIDPVAEQIEALSNKLTPPQLAVLWLIAGDIEASHRISQTMPDEVGSFLHGVMHRREGDFGNAKYWMAKLPGRIGADLGQTDDDGSDGFESMIRRIVAAAPVYGSPRQFVDTVAATLSGGGAHDAAAVVAAQHIEWESVARWVLK